MPKKILVTITGIHYQPDSEPDEITLMVPGTYFLKNGVHYLSYRQADEENPKLFTDNLIKLSTEPEDRMEVSKKGATASHFVYRNKKTEPGTYQTPFGSFDVSIRTHSFHSVISEEQIYVDVHYSMELNGLHATECRLKLEANL